MGKNSIAILIGIATLSAFCLSNGNNVSAAEVLSPSQMKERLTTEDTKEATPIMPKRDNTDDIGMPINSVQSATTPATRASYPNVNSYILQNNYRHPNITKELHQFEMFDYKTNDGKPSGVVVHYTDNPTNFSARNEADYVINGGWQSAFVHTFIDAGSILNIHDTDYGAWGSGSVGNKYFAQFEMVTARNFDDFAKTTSYSAWYTAYLLQQYHLKPSLAQANYGVGTIWSHSNVTQYLGGTDHTDPDAYFAKYGYSMSEFYSLVTKYYNEMINKETNQGSMDHLTANDQVLHTDGWYISSQSSKYPYSFIIVINQKTGREYKRYAINRNQRNDVANAYPNVANAAKSGFSLNVPVTEAMRGNTYKIISRYAQNASGEGSYKDYNFTNTVTVPAAKKQNKASMDSLTADKNALHISGWHASDDAKGRNYHYLILMDANANKEIRRIRVNNVVRKDVQNVYPNIYNTLNSGFNLSTTVDAKLKGKKIYVISRYSATSNADSNYVDYKFNNTVTVPGGTTGNKNIGSMDQLAQAGNQLVINGWHAASNADGKNYSFLILMNKDTGKEIMRYRINRNQRNDVYNVYPDVYGTRQSGFHLNQAITAKLKNKRIYVISRYANSASGEGSYVDHSFANVLTIK